MAKVANAATRSYALAFDALLGLPDGNAELLVGPAHLPVELRPLRLGEATANRRPLGDSLGEQVIAIDLQPDLAPVRDVAIEPLRTECPGERQLGAGVPLGECGPLGGACGARLGQFARPLDPPPESGRQDRVIALRDRLPWGRAENPDH